MTKVLVISVNAFSRRSNNGKTAEAMFSSFPKDDISQLFFHYNGISDCDFDYCNNYYCISEQDLLHGTKGKKVCSSDVSFDITPTERHDYVNSVKKISVKRKNIIRDILWSTNFWKNKQLKGWLKSTDADAVFFVGGGYGCFHKIARYISNFLNVPLVTYFTDDYLLYPISRGVLEKFQTWRMKRFYKKTVEASDLLFCIGEKMAHEYSAYFGKPFYPIMNITDVIPYKQHETATPPVIAYFGGLHLNRWAMIAKFADAVKGLAMVRVYTFSKMTAEMEQAFSGAGVEYMGGLVGDALAQAMTACDYFLHVESDDLYNRRLTRLSVSTKLPEYLMYGKPIIGFGPEEVASMCMLSDNHIGMVISSDADVEAIRRSVMQLLSDNDLYHKLCRDGYDYACNHFDKRIVAANFRKQLDLIVNK